MKNFSPTHIRNTTKGFTLIETMVAVFILTVALTGFFSVMASSLFSARYANNEITATYLIQEGIDSIRGDRDTFQQQTAGASGWDNFIAHYGDPSTASLCFSTAGCQVEPTASPQDKIKPCTTSSGNNFGAINCDLFYYEPTAAHKDFYTYYSDIPGSKITNFKRQVTMKQNASNVDEIDIKVTVEWLNGNLTRSQSLTTSLLNWRKNL